MIRLSPAPGLAIASLLLASLTSCASPAGHPEGATGTHSSRVLLTSQVEWEQLNPARGDQSPRAGTLWGDRTGPGPAGFLLRPVDGFESPPHIHNVAYRGVVIRGLIHNDDPQAEKMFMPTGSFWTQPAGGVHITAAKGSDCLAYIEVEDSFGVLPAAQAFTDPEVPLNVDASNLVWLDPPGESPSSRGAKIAYLWGEQRAGALNGTLIRLPRGFKGTVRAADSTLQAIVIDGQPTLQIEGELGESQLEPGSYFSSKRGVVHRISNREAKASLIYLRAEGTFDLVSTQ